MADSNTPVYGPWSEWKWSDEHDQYYTVRQVQDGSRSKTEVRWLGEFDRFQDTCSAQPASSSTYAAPEAPASLEDAASPRENFEPSIRRRMYDPHVGHENEPIASPGYPTGGGYPERDYAGQSFAANNGRFDSNIESQGYDSAYASYPAEAPPRPAVERTQSAPATSVSHEDVQDVYDLFVIVDGHHRRVDGGLDTKAQANFITMGTFRKLGLDQTDIMEYSEAQEAVSIAGTRDILGWISISWYFAKHSKRKFRHQFDVVDSDEELPLFIGRPTLNREKLVQFRIDEHVRPRKQVYVTGKRPKSKRPKDTYEAPRMIAEYPENGGDAEWFTLTPQDEVACREAAHSASGISTSKGWANGREYRVRTSPDKKTYWRIYY